MKGSDGNWLEEEDLMATKVVKFYQNQFQQEEGNHDYSILYHIPTLISKEENNYLSELPDKKEVKHVVFNRKGESSCGSVGMSGLFYQVCWEIVGLNVVELVKVYF